MGKIVKLTEEELHKIIREKIQEALEHNVDLDYSPAIGNKKRGPGKETLDQMKKRKNTKLDESLDETFDERDDDIEFFEDEENYKDRETEISLTEEDYEYAFEKMFGKADNVGGLIEKYNLPDWTKIEYDLDVTVEDDTYWTPGGTYCELTRWEVKPEALEGYSEECQELIKLAAGYEVECNHTPYDFLDESVSKITLTQTQLRNLIKESIVNAINEYAYHEKQTKETPEEHEAFIKKKAAAKKREMERRKKDGDDSGAIDYHDYKHGKGNFPVMAKESTIRLSSSDFHKFLLESVKRVISEISGFPRSYDSWKTSVPSSWDEPSVVDEDDFFEWIRSSDAREQKEFVEFIKEQFSDEYEDGVSSTNEFLKRVSAGENPFMAAIDLGVKWEDIAQEFFDVKPVKHYSRDNDPDPRDARGLDEGCYEESEEGEKINKNNKNPEF